MCGIAGYTGSSDSAHLEGMIKDLANRGPDGDGRYRQNDVQLGHTRLSIIDIEHGQQPMLCDAGRFVITFNGEVYNYIELRDELIAEGQFFKTSSDTEVILKGFARHGRRFVERLNGMFAFAIFDIAKHEITLARDHFGIKPLYFARHGPDIVVSSSSRSVARHPAISSELNTATIQEFLQFRYAPSGHSFYRQVQTLAPGHMAIWTKHNLVVEPYWKPKTGSENKSLGPAEWRDKLAAALDDAVRIQLRSDVPVGVFLSGGVDSTLIQKLASRRDNAPVKAFTFSIGDRHDEVSAAAETVRQAGLEHRVVRLDDGLRSEDLLAAVSCMDQPVGDAIILPTYKLCQAAAKECKVVLTGEGADEIFGGYVHFSVLEKLASVSRLAPWLRHLSPLVRCIPWPLLDRFFNYPASLGIEGRNKIARMLSQLDKPDSLARYATSVIDDSDVSAAISWQPSNSKPVLDDLTLPNLVQQSLTQWLPNQILHKMDQLSMAHGLEARVPYLDPHVFELMAQAPSRLLLNGKDDKVLLRQVAADVGVPAPRRRKIPFNLPVETLYREDLAELSRVWLSDDHLQQFGVFQKSFVEHCVNDLHKGEFLNAKRLICLISLHMWMEANNATL